MGAFDLGKHEADAPARELVLLDRLRRQLEERERVRVQFRSDMAALLVYRSDSSLPVFIFVGYGGAYFSWQSAEKRHPVDDIDGAAQSIAAYIRGD